MRIHHKSFCVFVPFVAIHGKGSADEFANPSEEKQPIVNEGTRINTNTDGPPSMTSITRMLLRICALGVTMSTGEAHPGARASRPHKSWHSFGHLLNQDRPATAPGLCFGRAHAVPAGSAAGCRIAGKVIGNRRDSMRAGRPRSRVVSSRWCGGRMSGGRLL